MIRSLMCSALFAVAIFFSNAAAAQSVVAGEEHCVINVRSDDRLNMRAEPRSTAPIVTQKRFGECGITVTDQCRGSWCPVEDGHHRGWVHSRYIAMVSPSLYCVSGVAAGDDLKLRAWPSAQSRILAALPRNQCDIAFLPFSKENWQKIRVSGREGWVNRRYLSGQ
jgi:SH3-like domain-containing protein